MRTAFTIETFADDVTSFVTRSPVKTRIAFTAAVLTVDGGSIGLKRNSRKLLDPLSTKKHHIFVDLRVELVMGLLSSTSTGRNNGFTEHR